MIKKEFYGILLVLLTTFFTKGIFGQCTVNITVEKGPVIRVKESNGFLLVGLRRSGNTTIEAKLNVSTEENTAKAGAAEDFITIAPFQTVSFAPNSTSAEVNITIVNDAWMEDLVKRFFLNLTTNDVNVCMPLPSAIIEIIDDDTVTVGFTRDYRTFNESHGNFSLSFFKNKDQTKIPITVSYSTPGIGNAVINTDYKNISGTMTFQVSQFTTDFPNAATIIDNTILEATKCFNITLTAKDNRVMLRPQQSKICIKNDDKVSIEFGSDTYQVPEQNKNVSLDIIKTGTATIPLKVRFNMVKQKYETAEKAKDYTDRNGAEITFEPNETKKTEFIKIEDDDEVESTEVFAVGLEAVDSDTTIIGAKNLAIVKITDDADKDFQATTQKQRQDEQKERVQLLTILLAVALGLLFVIIVVFAIVVCRIKAKFQKH